MTKEEKYPMAQYTHEGKHTFVILSRDYKKSIPVSITCPICENGYARLDKQVTENVQIMTPPKKLEKSQTVINEPRDYKTVHEGMTKKQEFLAKIRKERGIK